MLELEELFPQVGEKIPRSFADLRNNIRAIRTSSPLVTWDEFKRIGQFSGIIKELVKMNKGNIYSII